MSDKPAFNPEAPCFIPGCSRSSPSLEPFSQKSSSDTLVRFNECYHIGIPKEVDYYGPALDCPICALSFEGIAVAGSVKGPKMWQFLRMIIDDAHPCYGDNTIIRFYCAHQQRHGERCECEHLDTVPKASCTHKQACSQYFFATANDFKTCYASTGFIDLAQCWWAHQSRAVPIYNCIVALEVLTRKQFDFPIPIRGGVRAGYNPKINLVVICEKDPEVREKQEKQVAEAFARSDVRPDVCVIDSAEVRDIWSGAIPENRRDPAVAAECADRIIALGRRLLRARRFAPLVREFDNNIGKRQFLIKRIQDGRVLVREDEVINPGEYVPIHPVDRYQVESGKSGEAPPVRDPYKRMDNARVQKRKLRAQAAHISAFIAKVDSIH